MSREFNPLIRIGGFLQAEKLYVLSYEGSLTEKKYFEDFRASPYFSASGLIELISLKRPKNRGSDPLSVKRLLKEAKEKYPFRSTDEFWLIVDRDHWEEMHHHDFIQLAQDCHREGNFFLAVSNPCFELWLLLHRKSLDEYADQEKDRIFSNAKVSTRKHYIDLALGEAIGKDYSKVPNPEDFLPFLPLAIARAKALDAGQEVFLLQ